MGVEREHSLILPEVTELTTYGFTPISMQIQDI